MKRALFSILLLVASACGAQTYTRFGPADGILVGDVDSPQTTAAIASDVISLWTGTCNATTFLRADGSCQPASGGAGTVTSVGLTVPTGLSITGSPITTSGTLAISTTLNGLLRGTGSGFATSANSDVISLWTGTCDSTTFLRGDGACVTPGGGGGGGTVTSVDLTMPSGFTVTGNPVTTTGTLAVSTSLSGVIRGTGSGFAAATSSNVLSLWSGACSASTFLRGDGSCVSAATNPAGATGQIQFNNAGAFGADVDFAWDTGTNQLNVAGTVAATTLTGDGGAVTGLNAANIASGTLPVARGGTGTTTSTGTGSVVLSGSPTFSGTITGGTFSGTFSGSGAAVTNLNAANIASGTLPVARGGTGTTTSTGTGSLVLNNSPSFSGTVNAQTVSAVNLISGGQNVCTVNGTNCPPGTTATSGTYNPTAFLVNNCTIQAVTGHRYIRVGNVVTVSGRVAINVTSGAAQLTQFVVGLPIASDFTTAEQAHGSGSNDTNNGAPAFVYSSVADNRLLVNFYSTTSGLQSVYYTASYEVL